MKKKLLSVVCGVISCCAVQAQDIHFSHVEYAPLLLNPAYAGLNSDVQAIINYRTQYKSIAVPYNTFGLSYDMRFNTNESEVGHFILGANVFSDKSGDASYASNGFNLNFGYRKILNSKSTLGAALNLGVAQNKIDYQQLTWANQYDGYVYNNSLSNGETQLGDRLSYWDSGLGILYSFKETDNSKFFNNLTTGLAIFHLNAPKYQYIKSSNEQFLRRYSLFATTKLLLNEKYSLLPGLFINKQGKSNELVTGSYIRMALSSGSKESGISLGAYLRLRDAVIGKLMYEFDKYALGVAYDINVSSLNSASKGRGAFEIFLKYNTPSFIVKSRPRI